MADRLAIPRRGGAASPPRGRVPATPAAKIRPPETKALTRERLTAWMPRVLNHRLTLLVAPAGSGKTTLLVQFAAAAAQVPLAWYWIDDSDADPRVFFDRLERSLTAALPGLPGEWESPEDVARALESWTGPRALLVMDDFHAVQGSPVEAAVERLLDLAPPALIVLVASRSRPAFNLSRLRVSGALLEIGADDLRFRSWETERLFADFYRERLPPQDLALLTRRTEGWAAGLQLFHLATQGKHPQQQRRLLDALNRGSTLMREYLTRNVIDELPTNLRDFLISTCVLGSLSGALCDELLGRTGSARILDELERRQLFTFAFGEERQYRYHEILRSHLEAILVEEKGEREALERYRMAGAVLEKAGALPEALHAYCRGSDWAAVGRLLGDGGELLVDGPTPWVDLLPPSIMQHDPWLVLARARHSRATGQVAEAIEIYAQAEHGFGATRGRYICRRERLALAAWAEGGSIATRDWSTLIRQATIKDPLAVRRVAALRAPGPRGACASGVAALLSGHFREAAAVLDAVAESEESSAALAAGARLGAAAAMLLSGRSRDGREAERAAEDCERLGLSWLALVGRALLSLSDRPDRLSEAASARMIFERHQDRWGTSLAAFLEGWGALCAGGEAIAPLEKAVAGFAELGAGVLEAWARAALCLAMARAGVPGSQPAALQAEALARSLAVRGAQGVAWAALAEVDAARADDYRSLAEGVEQECSFSAPRPSSSDAARSAVPWLAIDCFGTFDMRLADVSVELASVRPRSRQTLRMLALHAGQPVHREVLTAALWPEVDMKRATRNLHVAISSLRRAFERCLGADTPRLIIREGDTYRLAVFPDSRIDLLEFDRALWEGRAAHSRGDLDRSMKAYRRMLDLHRADLLADDGPAEWVVDERERRRSEASEAALALATMLLQQGEPEAAAAVCERGLRIDRYRDQLWRLRITSCRRAGDPAAAAQATREYESVLIGLGVPIREAALAST